MDGPALSRRERAALQGVLDTLLPVACDGAIDAIERAILGPALHDHERRDARTLLLALSSALGTSMLCLSPSTRAFAERTRAERERLLVRLGTSPLHLRRKAFLALKRLTLSVVCSYVPDDHPNPLWAHAGYPGPAPALEGPAASLPAYAGPPASPTLDCDVVVVGSGAGGGVAAAVFARAGLDVVVLEKGSYVPPAQLSGLEMEAFATLYEKGGLLTTSDGAIGVLAGSTLGGGTPLPPTPQPPRMHRPPRSQQQVVQSRATYRRQQQVPPSTGHAASRHPTSPAASGRRAGSPSSASVRKPSTARSSR